MSQRRKQIQAPEEEGWIWGNSRGGGGAPLKDTSGAVVTNLRQVVRGAVEVDHSSPSERRRPRYDTAESQYGDDDYSRDHYHHEGNRSRRQDDIPSVQSSPKKFMSALRDMNSSSDEREAKYKKELEYQALLREQIEEKKREKASELKKLEDQKLRELDQFKSESGWKRRVTKDDATHQRQHDDTFADDRGYGKGKGLGEDRRLDQRNLARDDARTSRPDLRNAPRDSYGNIDRRLRPNRDEYEDIPPQKYDGSPRRGLSHRDETVSKVEYDELSALCSRLMDQQDELKDEIERQARLIEDLRADAKDRATPPVPRAKSMQNARQPKPIATRPTSMRVRTEAGTDEPINAKKKRNTKDAVPKIAFGNPAKSPDKKAPVQAAPLIRAGASSLNRRQSKGNDLINDDRDRERVRQGHQRGRSPNDSGRNHKVGFSGVDNARMDTATNGFAKLAQAAKVGPVVVTYEDEATDREKGKRYSGNLSSLELNGESEYLRIGRAGGDVIGGDQLDRLLVQARRARAAP